LPRPVGSAFRVFVYPLSGFLLPNPLEPFFRPKRSWDSPLQSLSPFEEPRLSRSGFALLPFSAPDTAVITMLPGLQSLHPFKEPYSRVSHYTKLGAAPLLGFPNSEVLLSSDPAFSRRFLPLPHFPPLPRKRTRCPRVLLPEERHSSEERAYPSAVFSLFSRSNLFNGSIVAGLSF
jgi:hypothetical protein